MIDLHCHILPALDDGPRDMASALDLARAAVADATEAMVATPHIREDYPYDLDLIEDRAHELRAALSDEGIPLRILTGGEVASTHIALLDDERLNRLCLGDSRYVLLEPPFTHVGDMLEHVIFDLQMRGFHPIIAHPERSAAFQLDRARLVRLVNAGVLTSVTAGSMTGRFGSAVQEFTVRLFREGLVHDVASDAHDARKRPPGMAAGFEAIESSVRGLSAQMDWFTKQAPGAIVAGRPVPDPPSPPRKRLFSGL
jgi:protein-tyrosine phosphatase